MASIVKGRRAEGIILLNPDEMRPSDEKSRDFRNQKRNTGQAAKRGDENTQSENEVVTPLPQMAPTILLLLVSF